MSGGFEGSYLGDAGKLAADARLECGICWLVYDPAEGDEAAQIGPGVAFSALPGHWRCPVCDAEKRHFMVLCDDGAAPASGEPTPDAAPAAPDDAARLARLIAAYRAVEARMRGLPIHNPALMIEAVGFGRVAGGLVGVVTTPWCMNLTFLPDTAAARPGDTVTREFPAGAFDFTAGALEGFGPVETCSLFSPMDAFQDPAAARLAAEGAMAELLTIAAAPAAPPPAPPPAPSRRALFAGAGG
jgi:[NiFe] hydrogenase assembly HybE family chaperone